MKLSELLTDETKWTKKRAARNSEGVSVASRSEFATCWCLLGAVNKCFGFGTTEYLQMVRKLYKSLDTPTSITEWNDHPDRNFEEVQELIRKVESDETV